MEESQEKDLVDFAHGKSLRYNLLDERWGIIGLPLPLGPDIVQKQDHRYVASTMKTQGTEVIESLSQTPNLTAPCST